MKYAMPPKDVFGPPRRCYKCREPVVDGTATCAACRKTRYVTRPMRRNQRLGPAARGAFAVEASTSRKVGDASATYASQVSCPAMCPFLQNGCYAENGFMGGFITKRLNKSPAHTSLAVARDEADAIDELAGSRDLRLHMVGDCRTEEETLVVAAAARRYLDRAQLATGRRPRAWTYTHSWREVPREAWGEVSVLASCESAQDVVEARAQGYAAAVVVERHYTQKRHDAGPLRFLPCPEQTRGVTCVDCRLCMDDQRLLEAGLTIEFEVHGRRGLVADAVAAAKRRRG